MRWILIVLTVVLLAAPRPAHAQGSAILGCVGENELPRDRSKVRVPYPFDVARIQLALQRHSVDHRPVTVLVVDNGFAGYNGASGDYKATINYPEIFFFRDRDGKAQAASRYVDPGQNANAGDWGHGTHITGVILGGMYGAGSPSDGDPGQPGVRKLLFEDFQSRPQGGRKPREWLQVYVASIHSELNEWDAGLLVDLSENGDIPPALRKQADIVNMSLASPPRTDGRADSMRTLPSKFPFSLVVVSAGNGQTLLKEGRDATYPAMSDVGGGNLIVIAAHNSDGGIFEGSSRHPTRVTLAAPGCAIRSWYSGAGEAQAASGTSQAAAVVSFAAALLKSRWAQATPNDLRERLITSSRFSRGLSAGCADEKKECVRWGSMLDIEMMLYFDTDVVEYCVDGKTAFEGCVTKLALGTLESAPKALTDCVHDKDLDVQPPLVQGINLSRPGAIRALPSGRFQLIVRAHSLGITDTLDSCLSEDVPPGQIELKLEGDGQPDGLPATEGAPLAGGDLWRLPLSRVVRIVARSTSNAP